MPSRCLDNGPIQQDLIALQADIQVMIVMMEYLCLAREEWWDFTAATAVNPGVLHGQKRIT